MPNYTIYTDGAYSSSSDCGGASAIIVHEGNIVNKLYQGYKHTTNNRMELSAVLYALKWFKEPSNIIIYSDSQYIVNSINNGSARKWFQEQDYSKKNLDIWVEILDLIDWNLNVEFRWVKGHADNAGNILVDTLCTHAANCLNLKEDICISD